MTSLELRERREVVEKEESNYLTGPRLIPQKAGAEPAGGILHHSASFVEGKRRGESCQGGAPRKRD